MEGGKPSVEPEPVYPKGGTKEPHCVEKRNQPTIFTIVTLLTDYLENKLGRHNVTRGSGGCILFENLLQLLENLNSICLYICSYKLYMIVGILLC